MPTFAITERFRRDYEKLTATERQAFNRAVRQLVEGLRPGAKMRRGLRVHPLRSAPNVYSITWAPDGRATFQYGESVREGDVHIVWRRVGSHAVYDQP